MNTGLDGQFWFAWPPSDSSSSTLKRSVHEILKFTVSGDSHQSPSFSSSRPAGTVINHHLCSDIPTQGQFFLKHQRNLRTHLIVIQTLDSSTSSLR
ncbi:hypothetical protein PGT21_019758 [Puccinia graminis f. sp. tritici]|uniref:Uncharacterized protein n=1 Tax=Puccinia graminis f. sp. tritici TaxID=56615 RepID=A0A5B0NCM2_PUCGR|nr:hypothetical protein PGT21_019758 [Puccinia graminis f. sp. tritici]